MTTPTPSGNASLATQYVTGQTGLPSGWQNQPTTTASFNEAIQVISLNFGSTAAQDFQAWYQAARAKDPKITPNQAVAAWVTGSTLAKNIGATAGALTKIPQAAATGAEKATKTLTTGPLSGLDAIGAFFNDLTSANTWIRVAKVIVGGVLLIVGLVHITGADNAVATVAKKVPLPI